MTDPHYANHASEAREEIARRERGKITDFLECGADYWDEEAREAQDKLTFEWRSGNAYLLRSAAREIRDGAHKETS